MLAPVDDAADLLERWARGWAHVRGLSVRSVEPGLRIDVNATSRRTEFVLPRPTADRVRRLATQVAGRQDVWLTLDAGTAREIPEATTHLELISTVEALMVRTLAPEAPEHDVELGSEGGRAKARIEIDGQTAASGAVGVDGTDAFFDRIETGPEFRRRGLGSRVMRTLSGWAFERGATTGILAASADGQRLYGRLGWSLACPLIAFRGGPVARGTDLP